MAIAMIAVLTIGFTAAAHSGLGAASPAPGSTVGGEITAIELRYADAVTDVSGSVTAPDGTTLQSELTQGSSLAITIQLAMPLTDPGEYAVTHASTGVADGDRVEAAYLFTFDPEARPPRLEILEEDDGGRSVWVVGTLFGGALLIAMLSIRLIITIRRRVTQPNTG